MIEQILPSHIRNRRLDGWSPKNCLASLRYRVSSVLTDRKPFKTSLLHRKRFICLFYLEKRVYYHFVKTLFNRFANFRHSLVYVTLFWISQKFRPRVRFSDLRPPAAAWIARDAKDLSRESVKFSLQVLDNLTESQQMAVMDEASVAPVKIADKLLGIRIDCRLTQCGRLWPLKHCRWNIFGCAIGRAVPPTKAKHPGTTPFFAAIALEHKQKSCCDSQRTSVRRITEGKWWSVWRKTW